MDEINKLRDYLGKRITQVDELIVRLEKNHKDFDALCEAADHLEEALSALNLVESEIQKSNAESLVYRLSA